MNGNAMRKIGPEDLNQYIDINRYGGGLYIVMLNTSKETYFLKFLKL